MLRPRAAERPAVCEIMRKGFFHMGEDTVEQKAVLLLALFSSPTRFVSGRKIQSLNLMKEISDCSASIPRRLREIRPAARFPEDIQQVIRECQPQILQFSGHGDAVKQGAFAGALAFQHADGLIQLPSPDDFIALLGKDVCPDLECVYLNGCRTLKPLGSAILRKLPHLAIIGWDTKTADPAALAFSKGFYDAIAASYGSRNDQKPRAGSGWIVEAFDAACTAMENAGYRRGDPEYEGDNFIDASGKLRRAHGRPGLLHRSNMVAKEFAQRLKTRTAERKNASPEQEPPLEALGAQHHAGP
jgi:hypothetical protein